MTRAQMDAARERVGVVLRDAYPGIIVDVDVCRRLVTAVLGHPDGKVPRVKPGREAQRVAHLPRRMRR